MLSKEILWHARLLKPPKKDRVCEKSTSKKSCYDDDDGGTDGKICISLDIQQPTRMERPLAGVIAREILQKWWVEESFLLFVAVVAVVGERWRCSSVESLNADVRACRGRFVAPTHAVQLCVCASVSTSELDTHRAGRERERVREEKRERALSHDVNGAKSASVLSIDRSPVYYGYGVWE